MIDVIVPVLGRPHRVAPLLESLAASTTVPYEVLFMVSRGDGDEIAAVKESGARHLTYTGPPAQGQYAKKINIGYRKTRNPWLFLGADDVRFHPGWAERLLGLAGERFHVLGTNDRANNFVRQGWLATHCLIRRSYVDDPGASLDGPEIVYHEGYSHNFVDCELSVLARNRGVFVFDKGAIVEHLHPVFGKGEPDRIYDFGFQDFDADRLLFCQRLAGYPRDPLARRFLQADRSSRAGRRR